jgi:hypothetical protein
MSYENIESPGNPIYKCNFDKWPEKYIPKNEKKEYYDIRQVNTFNNRKKSNICPPSSPPITKRNSMDNIINIKNITITFRNINLGMATSIEASLYDNIGKIIQKYQNQTGIFSGKFKYNSEEITNLNLSIKEIGIEDGQSIFVS